MSANWPASLPQAFKLNTYQPARADNLLRTPVDVGPSKTRRRSLVASRVERGAMDMTRAQWATLVTFYDTTLSGGTLQYSMFDPLGGASREVKFNAPPEPSGSGAGRFVVALEIEVLP